MKRLFYIILAITLMAGTSSCFPRWNSYQYQSGGPNACR